MNRTEIVLAAIGIISIVSLAGVTLAYTNLLATQQLEMNLLLYAYFGIPPTPYGIFFQVTNSTDPDNLKMKIRKITLSEFLALPNSTFTWTKSLELKTEVGPSLYTVLWTYFNLNITDVIDKGGKLNITVIGPESILIYPSSIWLTGNISVKYPQFDYAEGGGGGAQLYLGTMKLCAPPTHTSTIDPLDPPEQWIPWNSWVKGVTYVAVTFSYPVT